MSRARLFGTDGVRGRFGEPPLDRATITRLARALAATLKERAQGYRPTVILGGDTRESTPRLAAWLTAVLESEGLAWRHAGVVPTPAVARLVGEGNADVGIVLSASHNPHHDNGIKLLDAKGFKWSEGAEAELEERMAAVPEEPSDGAEPPPPEPDPRAAAAYLDALVSLLEEQEGKAPLQGLSLALDAANGAASPHAQGLFERLGASVELLHASPDGRNINQRCGSTAPEDLARVVTAGGHPLGFAFDGDADRAILVDEKGTVRDGDALLYLWATDLVDRSDGGAGAHKLVATVMSNLGLEIALRNRGIEMVRCPVGDRQVVEALQRESLHLGGEQSGHIVHLGLSTTGDGLLTALQVAAIVARRGRPVTELLAAFQRFPQILINVPVARREPFDSIPRIVDEVRSVENRLDGTGRLLLRYSGTEPLARVMMEGPDQGEIQALAESLAGVIRGELGA